MKLELVSEQRNSIIYNVYGCAKIFKQIKCDDELELKKYEKKTKTVTGFRHPNIVKYYGWLRTGDKLGILQELVAGGDISRFTGNQENIINAILQICEGLNYLHEKGYFHCDIKPSNILISKDGIAKLTDFEYMIPASQSDQDEVSGYTPGYAAPEVIEKGIFSKMSEIYCLGMILGELLSGTIGGDRDQQRILPDLAEQKIDQELIEIFLRMTAEQPKNRYQDIKSVEKALNAFAIKQGYYSDIIIQKADDKLYLQPADFVNRENEYKSLFDELERGEAVVIIRGARGIGKSALIDQIGKEIIFRKKDVIKIKCRKIEAGLQPLNRLLIGLLKKAGVSNLNELLSKGIELPPVLRTVLPELWSKAGFLDNEDTSPALIKDLFFAVQELMGILINGNLTIIIDDLHWASDVILMWLDYQFRMKTKRNYNLIGVYRREDIRSSFDIQIEELDIRGDLQLLELTELSKKHSQQIVEDILSGSPVNGEGWDEYYRLSAGNPLFLRDMLYYLQEQGLLNRVDNKTALPPLDSYQLPPELKEIILGKRERLSQTAIYILELLSVLGSTSLQPLANISRIDIKRLIMELAELKRVMFISRENDLIDFTHESNQEEIYKSIPTDNRKHYHQIILIELEKSEDACYEFLNRLAYHSYESGNHEKALHYNCRFYNLYEGEAGVLADQETACRRILEIYRKTGNSSEQIVWLSSLIGVLLKMSDKSKLEELVKNNQKLVAKCEKPEISARYWLAVADYYIRYQDIAKGEEYLKLSSSYYENCDEAAPGYIEYLFTRLQIFNNTQHIKEAMELSTKAIDIAKKHNKSPLLRKLYGNRGTLHHLTGDYHKALEYYLILKDSAQKAYSILDELTANYNIVILRMRQGAFSEAEKLIKENIEKAQQIGSSFYLAASYNQKAHLNYFQGNITESLEEYENALAIYQKTGNESMIGRLFSDMGVSYLKLDAEKAIKYFDLAMASAELNKDYNLKLLCSANLGLLYKQLGDYRNSIKFFEKSISISQENSIIMHLDQLFIDAGELFLLVGELEKGRNSIENGLEMAKKNDKKIVTFLGLKNLSEYYRLNGDTEKAEDILDEILKNYISSPNDEIKIRFMKWQLIKKSKLEKCDKDIYRLELIKLISSLKENQKNPEIEEIKSKLQEWQNEGR
jgi:serine/threonine protein kinase/tetratricopeptide (TPR) repeat protein